MLSFDGLLSQVFESGVGEAAEAQAEAEAEAAAARAAEREAAKERKRLEALEEAAVEEALDAEGSPRNEAYGGGYPPEPLTRKVRIAPQQGRRRPKFPGASPPPGSSSRPPPPPGFSPGVQNLRREARQLLKSSSAPSGVLGGRKDGGALLAPLQGKPSAASLRPAADWKPVRRRQNVAGQQLQPLRRGKPDGKWMPPKLKGDGAWGGILQAQHSRLAGVIAQQHGQMKQMEQQLAVLQQLNSLGSFVGEDPAVDDAVNESMAKLAPQLGRKPPQWQLNSPAHSRSYSSSPSKQRLESFSAGLCSGSEQGSPQYEVRPEADEAELQPRKLEPQLELEHLKEELDRSPEAQSPLQEQALDRSPEAESLLQEQVQAEAAPDEESWKDPLLLEDPQAEVQAEAAPDEESWKDPPLLEDPQAEVQMVAQLDDGQPQEQEDPRLSRSFFEGKAQASLMAASGGWHQSIRAADSQSEVWTRRHEGAGMSAASSWLPSFEAAAANSAAFSGAGATAQVLMANLDPSAYKNTFSTAGGSAGFFPGHKAFSSTAGPTAGFLDQIGVNDEEKPVEAKREQRETEEEGGPDSPLGLETGSAMQNAETALGTELDAGLPKDDGVAEEQAAEPPEAEEAEAAPAADGDKQAEAKEDRYSIRGRDWASLLGDCDALLQECKRPDRDDEDDEAGRHQELDLDL